MKKRWERKWDKKEDLKVLEKEWGEKIEKRMEERMRVCEEREGGEDSEGRVSRSEGGRFQVGKEVGTKVQVQFGARID